MIKRKEIENKMKCGFCRYYNLGTNKCTATGLTKILNCLDTIWWNIKNGYWSPRLKTKRGIILKFADRLSNLSRIESWDKKRQEHYLKKSKFWKSEGPQTKGGIR